MDARVLKYDTAGTGEPPLVLLPGGLTGWQSWLPLVPALSADRVVVRVQPICNAEGLAGRRGDPTYNADVERESIGMIRGQSTSPWLRGVAEHLAENMPEAKLAELEGGHACILERPEDFVAALGPHIGTAA